MTSHEVIVKTIAATTTDTGLTVPPNSTPANYPTGIKITDQQMSDLERTTLRRHDFHGDWNYTVTPGQLSPTLKSACY